MNLKRMIATTLTLTLGFTLLTGCGSSAGTESSGSAGNSQETESSSVVNIAIQPSAAFIPLYVAKEKGWIEEALKEQGVTVNWNDFESGPPMNESLASGSSDIGVMGDVPTVSAIAAGQQTEIVAVAANGPQSYAMLVSQDSDIQSPADLKGKKIGTTIGSTGHNLVDKLLTENQLDINSDIELVNVSTGDVATVLSNGEVDAVAIWEPTVTRNVDSGVARIMGDGSECGLRGVNPIIARAEYAQNNPQVIQVIIEQYARAAAELETMDDDTKARVAAYLSLEPEQLLKVSEKYNYTVAIGEEDIASLQDTIGFLVKIGNLDEEYEIKDYVNTAYLNQAGISQ